MSTTTTKSREFNLYLEIVSDLCNISFENQLDTNFVSWFFCFACFKYYRSPQALGARRDNGRELATTEACD